MAKLCGSHEEAWIWLLADFYAQRRARGQKLCLRRQHIAYWLGSRACEPW